MGLGWSRRGPYSPGVKDPIHTRCPGAQSSRSGSGLRRGRSKSWDPFRRVGRIGSEGWVF